MNLFKLLGEIVIDNNDAIGAIKETTDKAGTFSENLKKGLETAGKWATGIALAAATAAKAFATGIRVITTAVGENAREIRNTSANMGISARAYQEWAHVLNESGLEMEKMHDGLVKMRDQMKAAKEGSEDAINAFDALGISFTDANGNMKDSETMMREVILRLSEMGDTTERAQLASQILGSAGEEMAHVFNQGADGVEKLIDEAHTLGLVMSDEDIASGAKFADTLNTANENLNAIKNEMGIALIEPMQRFLDMANDNMPKIKDMVMDIVEPVAKLLGFIAGNETDAFARKMENIDQTLENTVDDIEDEYIEANTLIDVLGRLSEKTELTRAETEQWEQAVGRLTTLIPEFAAEIDNETHKIKGGTDALKERTEAMREAAIAEAKQNALQDKYNAVAAAYEKTGKLQMDLEVQKALLEKRKAEYEEAKQAAAALPYLQSDYFRLSKKEKAEVDAARTAQNTALNELMATEKKINDIETDLATLVPAIQAAEEELAAAERIIQAGFDGMNLETEVAPELPANAQKELQSDLNDMSLSVNVKPKISTTQGIFVGGYSRGYMHYHAEGLDRVPYDNYPAFLHKGEAVLNAQAANQWRNGESGGTGRLESTMQSLIEIMREVALNTAKGHVMTIDTGAIVGATAGAMNQQLGKIAIQNGRRN